MQKRYYIKMGAANPQPVSSAQKKSHAVVFVISFFIILLLTICTLIGLYFLGKGDFQEAPVEHMRILHPTAIISPTTTLLKRTDLSLTVLNGGGRQGSAQSVASFLTAHGYAEPTLGNATRFTYRGITITLSSTKAAYLPLLQQDLGETFGTVVATISGDIKNDGEIIVGRP